MHWTCPHTLGKRCLMMMMMKTTTTMTVSAVVKDVNICSFYLCYLHVNTLTGFQNNLCICVMHVLVEKYNCKYVIFWQFISFVLSEPKHLFISVALSEPKHFFSCCLTSVGEYLAVYFDRRFYKFIYCYLFSPCRNPGRPVIACIQRFRRWHLGSHCCPWRFLNWMV